MRQQISILSVVLLTLGFCGSAQATPSDPFEVYDETGQFFCSGRMQTQQIGPSDSWLTIEGSAPLKITKCEEDFQSFRTWITVLQEVQEKRLYAPYQKVMLQKISQNAQILWEEGAEDNSSLINAFVEQIGGLNYVHNQVYSLTVNARFFVSALSGEQNFPLSQAAQIGTFCVLMPENVRWSGGVRPDLKPIYNDSDRPHEKELGIFLPVLPLYASLACYHIGGTTNCTATLLKCSLSNQGNWGVGGSNFSWGTGGSGAKKFLQRLF